MTAQVLGCIWVGDQQFPFDSRWVVRWVEEYGGSSQPVLYFDGKRVTKRWAMFLAVNMPADTTGENANTADV